MGVFMYLVPEIILGNLGTTHVSSRMPESGEDCGTYRFHELCDRVSESYRFINLGVGNLSDSRRPLVTITDRHKRTRLPQCPHHLCLIRGKSVNMDEEGNVFVLITKSHADTSGSREV